MARIDNPLFLLRGLCMKTPDIVLGRLLTFENKESSRESTIIFQLNKGNIAGVRLC
jgi:hypothetical protein